MFILAEGGIWDFFGFNFDDATSEFTDITVYGMMALVGTLLFIIKLAMMLLGSDDGGDFDVHDGDVDISHTDADASFSAFSLLSILAFFMGAGWMGLTCRHSWGFGSLATIATSVGFGVGLMMLSSGGLFYVRKLHHESSYDARTAIGHTGRVYLTIPARGEGEGQVEIDVSGRRKVMRAISNGKEIEAFTAVRVLEVRDDQAMVVEPVA